MVTGSGGQMQGLLASGAQPQTTAPATLPPFVASAPGTSKSLFDQFPFVESGTLLDIARHDFRPMDLHKLDSKLRDKADHVEGGLAFLSSRTSSIKDYPSLNSITQPLNTFFSILIAFAATSGKSDVTCVIALGALSYLSHLSSLQQQYEWHAVLRYHMDYHLLRRREMINGDYSGWGQPSILLITEHLLGHQRRFSPLTSSSSSTDRISKARVPTEQQTCFSFNLGNCTTLPCPGGRLHRCKKCESPDHGERACPKKKV